MRDTWSLDALYTGYDDPAFINDWNMLPKCIEAGNKLASQLSTMPETIDTLLMIIQQMESYMFLLQKLSIYISLNQSTDTSNAQHISYMKQLETTASNASRQTALFHKYIAKIKTLDAMINENETLHQYAFMLHEIKENALYLLSDDVEDVISKLNVSAGSAWGTMQEYLTSTLQETVNGETKTLSQLRNMAYSDDATLRKTAYEAELKSYDKIKDAIAFSLNNIKAQVTTIADLRGFDSPLAMTLFHSRMKQETLDALIASIEQYLPKFHAYLKRKAKLLGYENGLPWYELFAPLGEVKRSFTLSEAKDYLISHFKGFSNDLADMVEEAFDEAWIDFYPRMGKVGGAFCCNIPFLKQSRILTNFEGSLGDVVTLAHELGHAYHGLHIQSHALLNLDYTMPVAETASTFNENIIMNAAIDEADNKEKITLIDNQLQDLTQIICDIYSRFLFEKAVFEKGKTQFLFADELNQIMLETQKTAYGDGLDPNVLHPYMWVNKSHYYSSDLSFYNFPYAFGGLFARGLYVQYEKEGKDFIPKYQKLLHATTVSSVEDVAAMANIDLTSETFWKESLDTCVKRIDEFLELTKD